MFKKTEKGFTLVELLVVISIMSILTVITVSQFMTARKKSRDVSRRGDLDGVKNALLMYYADYGVFPVAGTGGIIDTYAWGSEFKDADYTYMKVLPQEKWLKDKTFCYVTDTDKKKFAIYGMFENTLDSDCHMNGNIGAYSACGTQYCYAVFSPNTGIASTGGFL